MLKLIEKRFNVSNAYRDIAVVRRIVRYWGKCINMSLSDISRKQVKNKVLYSELDVPFNKYLETLSKVTRLTNKVLHGQLNENDEDDMSIFSLDAIDEIFDMAQLRFLSLQTSIESKKVLHENWQQSNQYLLHSVDEKAQKALPQLKKLHKQLKVKLDRLTKMSDSVIVINKEIESLSDGRTRISITKKQWESELGKPITERLISENYLKRDNSSNNNVNDPQEIKYSALDDFSVGPQESKQLNNTLKEDLQKLQKELNHYKDLWLKDAEVFVRITDLFQEELKKRQLNGGNNIDVDMDEDVVEEDEYSSIRQQRTNAAEEEEAMEEEEREVDDDIEKESSNEPTGNDEENMDIDEETPNINEETPGIESPAEIETPSEVNTTTEETTPDI